MLQIRFLKYATVFLLPLTMWFSFTGAGWITFLPILFGFVLVPLMDIVTGASAANLEKAEAELARKDTTYDLLIFLTIPTQVFFSILFLYSISGNGVFTLEWFGKTISMGLMNGVFGINIAHELGHRNTWYEKLMARIMLGTTLFLHFYIEHNRGHHRNVGTPDDPASARKNENLYAFWTRTVSGSFISAWKIVAKERQRRKKKVWSLQNEFIRYMLLQLLILAAVWWFFGALVLLAFLVAALIGILLLETVNYIEHYGLSRKKVNEFRYEDVMPVHSWNSDHIVSRIVLFELTRHSDHHYDPSRPYQVLESMPTSSQLPTGYAGMMILSLFPPLWFRIMNPRLPA